MKRIVSSEMVTAIAIMALGVLSMSVQQPILPLYLTDIGVSPEILCLMLSVAMVGMVIGEGSWGWIADKVGLKIPLSVGTFMMLGLLVSGVAMVGVVFAESFPWLIAFCIEPIHPT